MSIAEFLAPVRALVQRFAYSALILLSVAIIVVGKADVALIERLRTLTTDAMAPVLAVLSRPAAAVTAAIDHAGGLVDLYRENDRLKAENAALLQWQQVARRLESENDALRALTHYAPDNTSFFITARVIGTAGGAYSRNLLIDRGAGDGLAKGQAAISGSGLVGRVAEVGQRAGRVLLLTDLNSRIPVVLESTHDRAILAGDNTDRPLLDYLPQTARPQPGDRVVTSGDGGVFPPGLPVGVVSAVAGGQVRVQPITDLSRVEYLRVVDFGLGGVLPENAVPAAKPARKGEPAQRP